MNKYFPVYAAILGVLALFLFLSPIISKFISADTQITQIELLKNNDFASETLNSEVWIKKTNNVLNSVKTSSTLRIENKALESSAASYTLLSQKVQLRHDKSYLLKIHYTWSGYQPSSIFYAGVQKNGPASPSALVYPLASGSDEISREEYFNINESFKDTYFYVFLSGPGAVNISELSLYEIPKNEEYSSDVSVGNLLPFEVDQAFKQTPTPTSTVSSTTIATAAPSSTPAPQTTVSPSASPSPTISTNIQTSSSGKVTFYPGWNALGLEDNLSSDIFSSVNLDAYQMLGGKWLKSSNSQAVFMKKAGILVYSSNKDKKSVTPAKTESQSSLVPSLGWNLLYNSSDNEVSDDEFSFSDGKTLAKPYQLKSLVNDSKASSDVYLVSSDQSGVSLHKISFPEEAIPAKTVFWFYLFKL